jgi:hypothetical protein
VARINPSTGRLIFNAKLVTADPIDQWFDGNHFKESTLYLVLYRFLSKGHFVLNIFFHVANFVINIPCWLQK